MRPCPRGSSTATASPRVECNNDIMKIIEYKLNNFFRLHSRCHHILSPLLVAAVIAPILATALPSSKVKISGLESIKWKFPEIEMDIDVCTHSGQNSEDSSTKTSRRRTGRRNDKLLSFFGSPFFYPGSNSLEVVRAPAAPASREVVGFKKCIRACM